MIMTMMMIMITMIRIETPQFTSLMAIETMKPTKRPQRYLHYLCLLLLEQSWLQHFASSGRETPWWSRRRCVGSIFQRIHQTIFTPSPHPKKNPFPPWKEPPQTEESHRSPRKANDGPMKAGGDCTTYLVTIKIISQFHDFPPPGGQPCKMYPQRAIYQRLN